MFCAISGQVPQDPVVSTLTGLLYERRLVEKALETHGKCPVTDESLTVDDLTPLKSSPVPMPRPVEATSIVGLLSKFQGEWDSLMLETFKLRKQNQKTKQELATALYQHDAAVRVIARLTKERDEARRLLAEGGGEGSGQKRTSSEMEVEGQAAEGDVSTPSGSIPVELQEKIKGTNKILSKQRKKMKKIRPEGLVTKEKIAEWEVVSHHNLHKTTKPGIKCVDVHSSQENLVVTGGVDGDIKIMDHSTGKLRTTLHGHKKTVTSVSFHPSDPLIISSSEDKSVRVWMANGAEGDASSSYESSAILDLHSASVSRIAIHPTGDLIGTASLDKTWTLTDIRQGKCLLKVSDSPAKYSCTHFHPDGLLLALGCKENAVQIWDVLSGQSAMELSLQSPSTSVSFSDNGYHMATGEADGAVKVWDLRKLGSEAQTVKAWEGLGKNSVHSVKFDNSGYFLAYGYGTKGKLGVASAKDGYEVVNTFENHKKTITGVCFAKDAKYVVSTSMDRGLYFVGSKE